MYVDLWELKLFLTNTKVTNVIFLNEIHMFFNQNPQSESEFLGNFPITKKQGILIVTFYSYLSLRKVFWEKNLVDLFCIYDSKTRWCSQQAPSLAAWPSFSRQIE